MEEQSKEMVEESEKHGGGFALVNEDLLRNVLSRLPALSFASAACVSRSWNHVCGRILSRPKLASALSINPSPQGALKEVLDKVLSQPIRPHFAIALIGLEFSLDDTHELITKRLGSKTPVVTSVARGIMGSDALTNNFREVQWELSDSDLNAETHNLPENINRGIVLIVGFVPGLKVDAIPLLRPIEEPHAYALVDKFVIDIRDYTASISGSTSPAAILMIGDQHVDLKPVLDKMDYAMSMETVIVGDESGSFLYRSEDNSKFLSGSRKYFCDAVALIFARDKNKSQEIGEIQFHVTLSTGVSPVGPVHKAVSVRPKCSESEYSTWLTARREGLGEILDGQRMLSDINDELENRIVRHLYIGVTKRRKCSIGSEKVRLVTSLAFHEVLGGDEEFLFVHGAGIKTGDSFRFYHSDPDAASSSCASVSEKLRNLKQEWNYENCRHARGSADNGDKTEVCGGIIFSCHGRGESFFGCPDVDSSIFLENFPGVPLAGVFCGGEIGRGCSISIEQEGQEQSSVHCCLRNYSTVYLVMSYTPATPDQ